MRALCDVCACDMCRGGVVTLICKVCEINGGGLGGGGGGEKEIRRGKIRRKK